MNYNVNPGYRGHPAISNSDLRYLHDPQLFQLNKQRKLVEEEEDYHRAGTLIDEFLLNREEFNEKFIQKPDFDFEPTSPNQKGIVEYILDLDDPLTPSREDIVNAYNTNYSKSSEEKAVAMYKDLKSYINYMVRSDGKQEYTADDWADLQQIDQNARRNRVVNRFLFNPKSTDRVFKHLQIIGVNKWGVKWKGELDLVVIDDKEKVIYNIDVKSTAKPAAHFNYAYNRYRYYRQQALYYNLLKDWVHENDLIEGRGWTVDTIAIVVEKSNLQKVYPISIPLQMLQKGEKELREAAKDIVYYNEHGWDEPRTVQESGGYLKLDFSEYYD